MKLRLNSLFIACVLLLLFSFFIYQHGRCKFKPDENDFVIDFEQMVDSDGLFVLESIPSHYVPVYFLDQNTFSKSGGPTKLVADKNGILDIKDCDYFIFGQEVILDSELQFHIMKNVNKDFLLIIENEKIKDELKCYFDLFPRKKTYIMPYHRIFNIPFLGDGALFGKYF